VECPRFDEWRWRLEQELNVTRNWWASQPKCTTKSGWITFKGGDALACRTLRQIMACRLGIRIIQVLGVEFDEVFDPKSVFVPECDAWGEW